MVKETHARLFNGYRAAPSPSNEERAQQIEQMRVSLLTFVIGAATECFTGGYGGGHDQDQTGGTRT